MSGWDVNIGKGDGCESSVYDDITDCTSANFRHMCFWIQNSVMH